MLLPCTFYLQNFTRLNTDFIELKLVQGYISSIVNAETLILKKKKKKISNFDPAVFMILVPVPAMFPLDAAEAV